MIGDGPQTLNTFSSTPYDAVQTSLKLVFQAHSDTLHDIRAFWRELCNKKTTFVSLSQVCVKAVSCYESYFRLTC